MTFSMYKVKSGTTRSPIDDRPANAVRAFAIGSKFAGLGKSPKFWPVHTKSHGPTMNAFAEMMLGLYLICQKADVMSLSVMKISSLGKLM